MNTPQVKFKVTDLTATLGTPANGISFVLGKAVRGRLNRPDVVFNTWNQFVKEHGGIKDGTSAAQVKRLFDAGGRLRFCNLTNYTTITDPATGTADKAVISLPFSSAVTPPDILATPLFGFLMKNPGADYNNISITVKASSNGLPSHFDIVILHNGDSNATETYTNLSVPTAPLNNPEADIEHNYLSVIDQNSKIVTVDYKLFKATIGTLPPASFIKVTEAVATFSGGSDGDALTDTDLIGDSASATGLYAFDNYEDAYQIFYLIPNPSLAVHIAGEAYAARRQDLQYWIYLSSTALNSESMIQERVDLGLSSKFAIIVQGYLKVIHPITGSLVEVSALPDMAGAAAISDQNFGPWYSFSGNKRGLIKNALGVVPNYGTPGHFAELNELANRQINSVISRDSQIKLWGSQTTLVAETQERFIGVVRGTMAIKKTLRPMLEDYLEEPNDMSSWLLMYYQVKPFLDSLVDKRALYAYRWEGDQFASSLQELTVNDPAEVTQGKYKVNLFLSFIVGMQEIEVNLILTPGNLTFDDASAAIPGIFNTPFNEPFN